MAGENGSVSLRALSMGLALLAFPLLHNCADDDDDDGTDPCPGTPSPAFAVSITAAEGPLPQDTSVRLAYGGGSEEYFLAGNGGHPSVMFCTPERGSAGSGGEGGAAAGASQGTLLPTTRLVCEVWVEGAATIWVSGGDYPELEAELEGQSNECGPEAVEEELVLGHPEPETKP
jgi:hypothetical protein